MATGEHAGLFAVIHLAEFLSLRFDPFFLHMTSFEIENTPQSSNPTITDSGSEEHIFPSVCCSLLKILRIMPPAKTDALLDHEDYGSTAAQQHEICHYQKPSETNNHQ